MATKVEKISRSERNKIFWDSIRDTPKYDKICKKMSNSMKGRIPWNKSKHNWLSKESNEMRKEKLRGRHFSPDTEFKNGEHHGREFKKGHIPTKPFKKGYKPSKDQVRQFLRRRKKSRLEIKFENIIQSLNLPYKFVGNGDFLIERKCPDFINTNGKKIAIEVFNSYHKEKFRGGLQNWKKERSKLFRQYGWKVLYFNEDQLTEEHILSKIGDLKSR